MALRKCVRRFASGSSTCTGVVGSATGAETVDASTDTSLTSVPPLARTDQNGTVTSSMMRFRKVSREDPLDLHEQVAAQIRRAIADGEAAPGERLAPAIDIAAILDVNKNTVIRALHTLRDEGLLDFTRGRGIRVVGTPQRGALLSKIDDLVAYARRQGFVADELVEMVDSQARKAGRETARLRGVRA